MNRRSILAAGLLGACAPEATQASASTAGELEALTQRLADTLAPGGILRRRQTATSKDIRLSRLRPTFRLSPEKCRGPAPISRQPA